jgi:hypothetical protein
MKNKMLLVAGIALTLSGLSMSAAQADSTVTLHPGDFDQNLRDVRSAGHEGFLDDGLAVWTDDNSGQAKVAEYWDVASQNLPASVVLNWSGTSPQPGSQIVFDFDQTSGNGNDFNILVGEPVYGNDFWLTPGSSAAAHGVCPETGGGFGSDCHGTLQEWQQAIPNAKVGAYGFSLGSGIKGAGVIHSVAVDSTTYRFSDASSAPTPMDVTGTSSIRVINHPKTKVAKARLVTDPLLPGTVRGLRLHWVVKKDNHTVYNARVGADQSSTVNVKFKHHTGRHTVTVYKNGVIDSSKTVRTGAKLHKHGVA